MRPPGRAFAWTRRAPTERRSGQSGPLPVAPPPGRRRDGGRAFAKKPNADFLFFASVEFLRETLLTAPRSKSGIAGQTGVAKDETPAHGPEIY